MLPINPAQIPKIYAEALKQQNSGQFEAALEGYSVILTANPRIAEVHYQVGRIFLGGGQSAKAVHHFKAAARLKPKEPAVWAAYIDAVAELTERDEIEACLSLAKTSGLPREQLVRLQDRLDLKKAKSRPAIGKLRPEKLKELVSLLEAGNFPKAEAMAQSLLKTHPDVALLADMLATAQAGQRKSEEAVRSFRKAIALDAGYAEAHSNLSRLLLDLGRTDEALQEARAAVKLLPGLAAAHQNMGAAHLRRGELTEAIRRFRKADELRPNSAETLRMLGNALSRAKDYAAAEESLAASVRLDPEHAETFTLLGQAQAAMSKEAEAEKSYDRALQLAPDSAVANGRMALFLQTKGDFEKAEGYFRRAIEIDPKSGENYRVMGASYKLAEDDPLIGRMIALFEAPETPITDRRNVAFALSKVMEDNKKYDQVFRYLHPANALMRQEFPYNIDSRRKEVEDVMAFFEGVDLPAAKVEGTSEYAPIFVTGMPRSGTTLVEQIIASHSQVSGAGEVGYGSRIAQKLMVNPDGSPRHYRDLSGVEIAGLGRDYEAHMRKLFPDAPRVTDKSIQTYTFMGLIRLALPKSRMIVVRRDPRDNLLSIYRNMFLEGTHLYSYNLSDLGTYYKLFLRLLDFWQQKIPDWFHVVEYEDLIADTEAVSRRLIAACGLDWEDGCLEFYKNKRRVETLSLYQVRQPIYASSMKAWQRYEDELGELFEALK